MQGNAGNIPSDQLLPGLAPRALAFFSPEALRQLGVAAVPEPISTPYVVPVPLAAPPKDSSALISAPSKSTDSTAPAASNNGTKKQRNKRSKAGDDDPDEIDGRDWTEWELRTLVRAAQVWKADYVTIRCKSGPGKKRKTTSSNAESRVTKCRSVQQLAATIHAECEKIAAACQPPREWKRAERPVQRKLDMLEKFRNQYLNMLPKITGNQDPSTAGLDADGKVIPGVHVNTYIAAFREQWPAWRSTLWVVDEFNEIFGSAPTTDMTMSFDSLNEVASVNREVEDFLSATSAAKEGTNDSVDEKLSNTLDAIGNSLQAITSSFNNRGAQFNPEDVSALVLQKVETVLQSRIESLLDQAAAKAIERFAQVMASQHAYRP